MPVRKRKQNGAGIRDNLRKALQFVKDKKLISKGLSMIPNATAQKVGKAAEMFGFGPRKRKRRVRRPRVIAPSRITGGQIGTGIFSDIGSGLGGLANGIGHGLFGGAKRRSTRRGVLSL